MNVYHITAYCISFFFLQIKPFSLNDTDMKYLLLYLEETYGLTNEKKIDNAIGLVANENKYHPIRDYLSALVWDGTERILSLIHI